MQKVDLLIPTKDTLIKLLDPKLDLAALQSLYESASDYFILIQNAPADKETAQELFTMLPPNKDYDDKYVLGVYSRVTETLIAIIDIVRDFPVAGEWIIGLILFAPTSRGLGLGKQVYSALSSFCRNAGATSIRIGVLESNPQAQRFWQSIGFVEIERHPHKHKEKSHIMIVMRHELEPNTKKEERT